MGYAGHTVVICSICNEPAPWWKAHVVDVDPKTNTYTWAHDKCDPDWERGHLNVEQEKKDD